MTSIHGGVFFLGGEDGGSGHSFLLFLGFLPMPPPFSPSPIPSTASSSAPPKKQIPSRQATIAYLEARDDIDPTRIGIVGASIGGNLACVASQKRWVKTAVNLSGKTSAVRNLAAQTNLELVSMFQIASTGDGGGQRAIWANELYGFTAAPRLVEVVPGSSAHGVAIFQSDPSLLGRIVDWLGETL